MDSEDPSTSFDLNWGGAASLPSASGSTGSVLSKIIVQDLVPVSADNKAPSCTLTPGLQLLARLIHLFDSRDLDEYRQPTGYRSIIRYLGDGATYRVEEIKTSTWREYDAPLKRSVQANDEETLAGAPRHRVARKTAKVKLTRFQLQRIQPSDEDYHRLKRTLFEIGILSHPAIRAHPNIASLVGYSWSETRGGGYTPCLIMELATLGTARHYTCMRSLSEEEKMSLCRDVASGLAFLHACNIVHGDVKQDNVLVYENAQSKLGFLAKITDIERPPQSAGMQYAGTTIYNASEVQRNGGRSLAKDAAGELWRYDVFAFGLLVLEVLSGHGRYRDIGGEKGLHLENSVRAAEPTAETDQPLSLALGLAGGLLRQEDGLSSGLVARCQNIPRITLAHNPVDRLPHGWVQVQQSLNNELYVVPTISEVDILDISESIKADAPFSVSELFSSVKVTCSDLKLSKVMWSDLEHAAGTVDTLTTTGPTGTMLAMSMNEAGKAAFSLFYVYALGNYALSKDIHDAIRYLTRAASANYGPAFVCGRRIFEANGIPVPDVLLRGPQNDPKLSESLTILRSLPNGEYYSAAIQLFWPPSLKTDAKRILPKLPLVGPDSFIDFTEWIKARADSMGAENLRTWVRDLLLFHHSVVRGSTDACDLLCRLGCDINYATTAGVTALHLAMRCAEVRVIELLLERGADPSINCNKNISPLHWLIVLPPKNVPRIVEKLLTSLQTHQKGGLSDFRLPVTPSNIFFDDLGVYVSSSPIRWAIHCRNLPVVAALMDLGVSPIVNPARPGGEHHELFEAVGVGCARITERLLQSDSYRQQLSSEREGIQAFSYLGNSGTYFSRWMMHGALHDGAFGQVIDVMERFGFRLPLCQADMIEVPGNLPRATPLCRAVMGFHLPVIKELLRRGCLVNDLSNGVTAIGWALRSSGAYGPQHKAAKVIHLLLEHGDTTGDEQPLVHLACGSDVSLELLRFLLKKASPADIKSVYNRHTLLHELFMFFMAEYDSLVEHQEKVKAVIEAGCDIDAEEGLGSDSCHRRSTFGKRPDDEMVCCRTALAYALDHLDWATGQYLIERGAKLDFGVQSGHSQTVLHLLVYKVCRLRIKVRDHGDAEQRNEADSVEWTIKDLLAHPIVKEKGLLNMRNYQGQTALDVAKSCRVGSVMRILCDERYAPLT